MLIESTRYPVDVTGNVLLILHAKLYLLVYRCYRASTQTLIFSLGRLGTTAPTQTPTDTASIMSKSSGFAPTPQQGMSRPGSPRGSIGGNGFDKDEDRQGLMMESLGDSRRPGERDVKDIGGAAPTAAQEQSESSLVWTPSTELSCYSGARG